MTIKANYATGVLAPVRRRGRRVPAWQVAKGSSPPWAPNYVWVDGRLVERLTPIWVER